MRLKMNMEQNSFQYLRNALKVITTSSSYSVVLMISVMQAGVSNQMQTEHSRSLLLKIIDNMKMSPIEISTLLDVLGDCMDTLCNPTSGGESLLQIAVQKGNHRFLSAVCYHVEQAESEELRQTMKSRISAALSERTGKNQSFFMKSIRPYEFASCANVPLVHFITNLD